MVDFRYRRGGCKQLFCDPEWRQPSCFRPRDPSKSRRRQFRCCGRPIYCRWEVLLQSFTTPGGQLTLTFDWFNKTNFAQFGSAIDGSTQSARVDILFNGASPFDVGAGVADNLMLNEGTLTDPSTTIPWESASFTITGLSAGTYELRFGNGQCCNFQQFGVDNVSLTTSVPEPQTWSLMLLGFAALGYSGYRRAHSAPKMNNLT